MVRVSMGRWALCAVCLLAIAIGGCRSTGSQTQTTPKPTGSEFEQGNVPPPRPSRAPARTDLGVVYFDFDSYSIRSDARPTLRANAEAIKENRAWRKVTIEGHCDERGSEEYNLALGERRANAVKQYLVDLGVPASKLRTVSFGEAKPAVRGHDESAWRYNRRSEVTPSG